ncbi:hypothetical protein CGERO_02065 [Corynebacterium gerontici]|uniref:Uncharacterized protein n=1 Tax=Corynebacterium gerontici TaxID=2079234 RepID=A0A3G6IYL8_9CORY|nr:hypothetical protein CGERO_02065 [Corynebacterium gerontici]
MKEKDPAGKQQVNSQSFKVNNPLKCRNAMDKQESFPKVHLKVSNLIAPFSPLRAKVPL